jgi:L-2-hydroxyglutarate oxidase LhgO
VISVDLTLIGGGIVGCATAAAVARSGRSVVLLEREPRLASVTTSRNSEVAHGGMYYPTGSLKARFCVRGRRLLEAFCAEADVPFKRCGKLIVACADEELPGLESLLIRGQANDVEGLALLTAKQVKALEPDVKCIAALHSPATGVVDAEGAAHAYARLAGERGAEVLTGARVTDLQRRAGAWVVHVERGRERWDHRSAVVINCSGLRADEVAAKAGLDVDAHGCRQSWVKGNYFSVDPRHAGRLSRLVYPVPPRARDTLGVHVCIDLAGQLRLGPDYEPLGSDRREDYGVDPSRSEAFFLGARRFLPFLARTDLSPGLSGIRPKLAGGAPFHDFAVRPESGDLDGLINLIGIDSPGLTAAPALAEQVAALVDGREPQEDA